MTTTNTRQIRSRQRWMWGVLVAGGPAYMVLGSTGSAAGAGSWWEDFVVASILVVWAVVLGRLWVARCPSCDGLFFEAEWGIAPWRRSCGHCGLPLKSPSEAIHFA